MSMDDAPASESLVVLVVDEAGAGSPLADACRRAGHHVMTATGVDTAIAVVGGLTPDLVLIRSVDNDLADRNALTTIQSHHPEVPIRVVSTPAMFAGMDAADSLSTLN